MLIAVLTATGVATAIPAATSAQNCPAALRSATRLLLVTTPDFNSFRGSIRAFTRPTPGAAWTGIGQPAPIVVGRKGLAWGWTAKALARSGEPFKREGDKRAPAGVFTVGQPFGNKAQSLPGFIKLTRGQHFCVDDPGSPHYGRIVPRSRAGRSTSGEEMSKISLYRKGLIVNYPPNASKRAGSCIFIHVWRRSNSGTVGCVAGSEAVVGQLQKFASGHTTAIAVLPTPAVTRLSGCLPIE